MMSRPGIKSNHDFYEFQGKGGHRLIEQQSKKQGKKTGSVPVQSTLEVPGLKEELQKLQDILPSIIKKTKDEWFSPRDATAVNDTT